MKSVMKFGILTSVILLSITSCLNFVEDGLDIEYGDSDASLVVTPIGSSNASANETASFSISVNSNFEIKSCIIKTTIEGKNGSGFNVSDGNFEDPFADHNYGTIRPGIKNFTIRYDYIIPEQINKSRITFIIVDESGKVQTTQTVEVVPTVEFFDNIVTYAKDATFNDAIASSEGLSYPDIKNNYSALTTENVEVQKKIDIVFYYDTGSKRAFIAAPGSGRIDLDLSVENQTLFRRISLPANTNLAEMSASELDKITADADLSGSGGTSVNGVKVGEFIAFSADLNAINSLKRGILKVEGLHPGSVPRYTGVSYVMECSLIVQK